MNQMGALTPYKDLASTPDRNGWSESQEDSGAAMHLMHGVEDFVLGHTDQVHITAGTARHDVEPTKLDIVGPILRVFRGTTKSNVTVNTLQYIGCGATDSKGEWAQLMSHNGIVRERVGELGEERNLDNVIDASANTITFGASRADAVTVQMTRSNLGSFTSSRPPTTEETEIFLQENPQFRTWTFGKLMSGGMKINMCKMTLRGQAFDALQCSQQVLDEIIRGNEGHTAEWHRSGRRR